jgi:hypothetical protein
MRCLATSTLGERDGARIGGEATLSNVDVRYAQRAADRLSIDAKHDDWIELG